MEADGDTVMTTQVEFGTNSGDGANKSTKVFEDETIFEYPTSYPPSTSTMTATTSTTANPTSYDDNTNIGSSSLSNNNFPTPLNLNTVVKRFKNSHYRPPRKFKNVKQMLVAERRENMPLDIPTCNYIIYI